MGPLVLDTNGALAGIRYGHACSDEEEDHLKIFCRTLQAACLELGTQVIVLTVFADPDFWTPSGYHVVELARGHIKELIQDGLVRLKEPGPAFSVDRTCAFSAPLACSPLLTRQGFRVDDEIDGITDRIAYALIRQHHRRILLRTEGVFKCHRDISTFDPALPGQFHGLSDAAQELLALHKAVITGLGDSYDSPTQLTVYTTMANSSKWPRPEVVAVDIAQRFILDQIMHSRVVLKYRPMGSYMRSYTHKRELTNPSADNGLPMGLGHKLPTTLTSLILAYFHPGTPVTNFLVEIARTSQDLAVPIAYDFEGADSPRASIASVPGERMNGGSELWASDDRSHLGLTSSPPAFDEAADGSCSGTVISRTMSPEPADSEMGTDYESADSEMGSDYD